MNREYRIRYDREHGRWVRKHVYGEGVFSDIMKDIGSKLFGETMKSELQLLGNTKIPRPNFHDAKSMIRLIEYCLVENCIINVNI